jgi:DNA-binding protein HU-beta
MNKKEFATQLAEKTGMPKVEATRLINVIFGTKAGGSLIGEAIRGSGKDGKLTLPGFGTFYVSTNKQYTGHNPGTGAEITVPPRHHLRFRVGTSLKEELNP